MSYYPEYTIEERYPANKSICFAKCADAWGILSNFYRTPIEFEGTTYASVEQLYHSIRLNNTDERAKFLKLTPNLGIKMRAKSFKRKGLERKDWRHISVDVMRFCIQKKYEQSEEFRAALERSKGQFIIEDQSSRRRIPDSWGAVLDTTTREYYGKNIMGRILMEIREMGELPHLPFNTFVEETNSHSTPSSDYDRIIQACKYIGVDLADFNLRNDMFTRPQHRPIHGIGHLYRTMIGCALLAERLQKPRIGLLAFCGAYIHDLARKSDGREAEHGLNAVKYKFPRFEALWRKYNLSGQEREWICEAVKQHSTREWMRSDDVGYDVMAILKDADALDRCRIGDLDPSMLRYQASNELISVIERYWDKNPYQNTDIEFDAFCRLL